MSDLFEQIATASYEDVIYALQQDDTPDHVRRFVVAGDRGKVQPPIGIESFYAKRARALIERLLVLLEEDQSKKT